jgi:acyl-CoA synthetase (AMP-forming)/AMP-acid ligase II
LLSASQGEPVWEPLQDDDLFMVSYTSGTTGHPKGVMIKQVGVSNVILHCLASFGFSPDDVWSMPAGSSWVIVLMNLFSLGNGMTSVIPDGVFQITSYLKDIEKFRVTSTLIVPTMIQRVLAEVQVNPYDLSSLRVLMYGSAPATPKLIRETRERLGVAMIQTYGQTESSGGWLTVLTEKDHQLALSSEPELLRSIGRVGLHYECSIRDEQGQPVPPNTKGEIWLRGESVMKGYLNLPEATAEALPGDGWLRTNDIGRMDERGYVYLLDRQKFMIITGAVNVFPTTVEAVVSEHPGIQEVAVLGVPHPEWGESVVAVAVRRTSHPDLTAHEVMSFCDGKLSRPETPKHVVFVTELLKTVNGKLRKNDIRAWLLQSNPSLIPWNTHLD